MGVFSIKVVMITGADGGIGREITKKFAAEGATMNEYHVDVPHSSLTCLN